MICRELGFVNSYVVASQNSSLSADFPINIAEISCVGTEESLEDCHFVTTNESTVECMHKHDLFVRCLLPQECNKLSAEFPLQVSPMEPSVPVGMLFT